MVSDSTFEDKLKVLEQWIKTHPNLPAKIGKKCNDHKILISTQLKKGILTLHKTCLVFSSITGFVSSIFHLQLQTVVCWDDNAITSWQKSSLFVSHATRTRLWSHFYVCLALTDPVVLRRYLHSVHHDLDQTKKLIEHSYCLRNKYPNIFCKRDPLSADAQKIFQVA